MTTIPHHPALDSVYARLRDEPWIWVRTTEPIAADAETRLRVVEPGDEWEAVAPAEKYGRWPGYTFMLFGRRPAGLAEPDCRPPHWELETHEGSCRVVDVWFWTARRARGPFAAYVTWTPERGVEKTIREAVPAWHRPDWSNPDLLDAGEAMRLLHYLQEAPSKPGPVADLTREELRAALLTAIRAEWLRRRRRPRLRELATYFTQSPTLPRVDSPDALRKRIDRADLDLDALYRKARPPG